MLCWDINLREVPLRDVIKLTLQVQSVDRMMFVIPLERANRNWKPRNESLIDILHQYEPNLIDMFLASGWPGSDYMSHPGLVCVFAFNQAVISQMLKVRRNLSRWTIGDSPPLPEDICFFKSGASIPTFASCTHEGEGWLLSKEDYPILGIARRVATREMFIFKDRAFCRLWNDQKLPVWAGSAKRSDRQI